MYDYFFHEWVEKDLLNLDGSAKKLFLKILEKIRKNPEIWKNLWNVWWIDLTWFKKIYFDWKKKRVVYKVNDKKVCIYVISVWKREKMEVYKKAFLRKN